MRPLAIVILALIALPAVLHADDRAVGTLVKRLKDKDLKDRVKAAQECAKLGPKAKAADAELVRMVFDAFFPEGQQPALDALVKVRPDLGPPVAVLWHLKDPPAKCLQAAEAIGKLGRDGVLGTDALMRGIRVYDKPQRNDPAVVKACIVALGEVLPADKDVVGVLGQCAVLNAEVDLREAAIQTMAKIAVAHAELATLVLKHYRITLNSPNNSVRVATLQGIAALGEDAKSLLNPLRKLDKDDDPDVRKAVNDALDAIEKKIKKGK